MRGSSFTLTCIHLHVVRVDSGIHDNPSPTPQFPMGRQVNEHRSGVSSQCINNHSTILENLMVHI